MSGSPTCSPSPLVGRSTDAGRDGVTLVAPGCGSSAAPVPEFEVVNTEAVAFTYTVTFDILDGAGRVMDNTRQTVASVAPGRTVRRTVEEGRTRLKAGSRLRIAKVRAVPADEAPAGPGECPPSGIRVTADDGDAATGLRVVGLHLANCGASDRRLDGYPALQLLDEAREPVTGVRILSGTAEISTGLGGDGPPAPVTLRPGESASASLAWRNTTTDGEPVNVPYVRVTAQPGAPAVTVTPELDLGTTGRLGVGPWRKDRP